MPAEVTPMFRRPLASFLSLAAAVLAAGAAHAGAPFPWFGVHVTQASLTDCDAVTVDGAITLSANIPDDGRAWTWTWSTEADDGTNVATVGDGPFTLAATAGDTLLENTGSLLVGPSAPGALGVSYDFDYVARTFVDGILVLESRIGARCNQGTAESVTFPTRLGPPACGAPVMACNATLFFERAKLTVKDGNGDPAKSSLALSISGAGIPPDSFGDSTLALAEGGTTTAACVYDDSDNLIAEAGADAALVNAKMKPLWKRKATATKAVQRYADPKREAGPVRSLSQTAGPRTKLGLSARGLDVEASDFTASGLAVQLRTVSPLDREVTCTQVFFPDGSIRIDAAKGTVKAKIKPLCGPGCP
jgi:hypothetical protein